MLRLKGERADDVLDEADHREPLPMDELTATDAFPADPDDVEREVLPLRGLAIAAATFVPTFLAVFLGLPYLLGSVTTARTPSPGPPVAETAPLTSEVRPDVTASRSETLRGDSTDRGSAPPAITPRVFDEPAPRELPERSSRAEPTTPRAPEPLPEAGATAKASKPGEWTPAAAFADREAAGRLASSIEKQGYPVEVRQDGSSSRPWVVWIGAQPSGARRR